MDISLQRRLELHSTVWRATDLIFPKLGPMQTRVVRELLLCHYADSYAQSLGTQQWPVHNCRSNDVELDGETQRSGLGVL